MRWHTRHDEDVLNFRAQAKKDPGKAHRPPALTKQKVLARAMLQGGLKGVKARAVGFGRRLNR
jgi:hypothetical protein